ncbi:MAG TPA: ATP phosphoribosyltransferase [Longimicrobiales bacterium]|nr:ATP phosphoribosyltransferase [Longimicrobiales bacterium]
MIRIALPNKGRLAAGARELLERAGLAVDLREHSLQAPLGADFIALFVNARDIPEFVADGAADLGITGGDLVAEAGRDVEMLLDLEFGRCRLSVASREDSGITQLQDIAPGTRVATVFPNLTRRFFDTAGRSITLVPVSGAVEVAPHLGVADIIVDLVSTGSTLRVNGLVEVATVLESAAVLVGRPGIASQSETGCRARELVAALESVLRAKDRRYLMANVPRSALPAVRRILPGLNGPTIVDVMDGGNVVAAHAVVEQKDVYRTIAELKGIGAEGILVTRIERLMP